MIGKLLKETGWVVGTLVKVLPPTAAVGLVDAWSMPQPAMGHPFAGFPYTISLRDRVPNLCVLIPAHADQ